MSVSEPYTQMRTDPTAMPSTTMLAMATWEASLGSKERWKPSTSSSMTMDESNGVPPAASITFTPTPVVISTTWAAGLVVSGFHRSPVRS